MLTANFQGERGHKNKKGKVKIVNKWKWKGKLDNVDTWQPTFKEKGDMKVEKVKMRKWKSQSEHLIMFTANFQGERGHKREIDIYTSTQIKRIEYV